MGSVNTLSSSTPETPAPHIPSTTCTCGPQAACLQLLHQAGQLCAAIAELAEAGGWHPGLQPPLHLLDRLQQPACKHSVSWGSLKGVRTELLIGKR